MKENRRQKERSKESIQKIDSWWLVSAAAANRAKSQDVSDEKEEGEKECEDVPQLQTNVSSRTTG